MNFVDDPVASICSLQHLAADASKAFHATSAREALLASAASCCRPQMEAAGHK